MKYHWSVLISFLAITLILPAYSASQEKEDADEANAGPVESERVVVLEKEVHFLTPTGEDVVVSPGTYTVEAAEDALRLTLTGEETAQSVTVKAEATTHEASIEEPELITISEEEDQQVVILLMPDGKALEAVGSSSGIRERGMRFRAQRAPTRNLRRLPRIKGIFTAPRFGAISPDGRLYIKGTGFGNSKGQIRLQVKNIANKIKTYYLTVNNWSDTKIKATMPGNISGVKDTKSSFILRTAKGLRSTARTVNFYAARQTTQLKHGENVYLKYCSNGANVNLCLGFDNSDKDHCFYNPIVRKDATISAYHKNCDDVIDWDDGSDVYEIKLKNGWVFDKIDMSGGGNTSSNSGPQGFVTLPTQLELKRSAIGTSTWTQTIPWKISPGKDYVHYHFWVKIKGPKGVPYK